MILGWIQVDRVGLLCWKKSVDLIFDKNEYGVLLLDRIKKGLSKAFGYQKVGTGWRNGGIVWGYTSDDDSRADNQKLLFGQDEGGLFFHNDVLLS